MLRLRLITAIAALTTLNLHCSPAGDAPASQGGASNNNGGNTANGGASNGGNTGNGGSGNGGTPSNGGSGTGGSGNGGSGNGGMSSSGGASNGGSSNNGGSSSNGGSSQGGGKSQGGSTSKGGGSSGGGKSTGGASQGGSGGAGPATFAQVASLLGMKCAGTSCHGGTNHINLVNMSGLYMRLTTPLPSTNAHCGGTTLVVANDAANSFLAKVIQGRSTCSKGTGTEQIPRMPDDCSTTSSNPRACLTAAEIKVITDWIAAGAPQ